MNYWQDILIILPRVTCVHGGFWNGNTNFFIVVDLLFGFVNKAAYISACFAASRRRAAAWRAVLQWRES